MLSVRVCMKPRNKVLDLTSLKHKTSLILKDQKGKNCRVCGKEFADENVSHRRFAFLILCGFRCSILCTFHSLSISSDDVA